MGEGKKLNKTIYLAYIVVGCRFTDGLFVDIETFKAFRKYGHISE